jgi:hypothetical protein
MLNRSLRLGIWHRALLIDWWHTLVRLTFGLFAGSLIVLIVLLYAGVIIVAP